MSEWSVKLSNKTHVELSIRDSHAGRTIQTMLKHLKHVPVPFTQLDNPYTRSHCDLDQHITKQGREVGIDIDHTRLRDQQYLNHLHQVYEENYNGTLTWLPFHEDIHAIEQRNIGRDPLIAHVNWRTLAGPITCKLTHDLQMEAVGQVCAGDVFVSYAELGKPLYTYWRDNEPNDKDRIKQLCAPWTQFKPNINIALEDIDLVPHDWAQFLEWGQGINSWYWEEMNLPCRELSWQYMVIPIGHVHPLDVLQQSLQAGANIIGIQSC